MSITIVKNEVNNWYGFYSNGQLKAALNNPSPEQLNSKIGELIEDKNLAPTEITTRLTTVHFPNDLKDII